MNRKQMPAVGGRIIIRSNSLQPDDLYRMKQLFLLDPSIIFLNHGSFGACPSEVFQVYQCRQLEMERNPVEFLGRRSAALLMESRSLLAAYMGANPANLVYIPNATSGVNTVARSLALTEGDEILSTDQEYGACDNTWNFVCQRVGARYVRLMIPLPFRVEEFADRIWAGITARTRIIFLSHITSTTALIFPMEEICRRARSAGILTFIDGAHAPGHIPLQLEALGADFYTGNCHKWLCAPKGAAFLYARPEHHSFLDAPVISWGYSDEIMGHTGFEAYTGSTLFERRMQWQGTRDLAAYLSVPAAIQFLQQHDWDQVRPACHDLAVETMDTICNLTGLPPICKGSDYGQMAAIPIPPMDADLLKNILFQDHRIEVPVTYHQNHLFVRISVQGYNSQDDTHALVDALKRIYRL